MSVTNMNSRMAMAEKLSVPQLQQAIQSGSIPSYIGIPLIEQKMKAQKQASVPQQPEQKPIAQEVMEQASGIDSMPSNLPVSGYNDGGIVAFAEGGDVDDDFDYDSYLEQQEESEYDDIIRKYSAEAEAAGIEGIKVNRTKNVEKKYAAGGILPPQTDYSPPLSQLLMRNPEGIEQLAEMAARNYGTEEESSAPEINRDLADSITRRMATAENPSPVRAAFNQANDPSQDPRIMALRQDPAYLAFAESGGVNGDTGLTAFLEAGNTASPAPAVVPSRSLQSPLRMRTAQVRESRQQRDAPETQLAAQQAREFYSPNNASLENRNPGIPMGEMLGSYTNRLAQTIRGDESYIPSDLRAYSDRGMFSNLPEGGADTRPPAAPEARDFGMANMDALAGTTYKPKPKEGTGITNIPGARATSQGGGGNGAPVGGGGGGSGGGGGRTGGGGASERAERPKSAFDDFMADIKASRDELSKQKAQDKYMAIMQAGLGMMSGTSPNAFANIGQGAQAGVASYAASGKQRAAERAALNKNLLMGQRYQSMEDIANRTADISEARYRDAAAARAAGAGDTASLKSERALNQREADLNRAIGVRTTALQRQLETQFGKEGMYTNPNYQQEYNRLYRASVAPLETQLNALYAQRSPDLFGPNAAPSPAPAASSGFKIIK